MMKKNMVVQFNEKHKWVGCLGIIVEVKKTMDDVRYMVGVPVPEQGIAYIFVMESEYALEPIGMAVMVEVGDEE